MLRIIYNKRYKFLRNKIDYVLKCFQQIYDLKFKIKIDFSNSQNLTDKCIKIKFQEDALDFFNSKNPIPENFSFKEWKDIKLPLLFTKNPKFNWHSQTEKQAIEINYDILLYSFYFLSLWQEWYSEKKDYLGKFPINESLLFKNNLLEIPVVNYYFDIFKEIIEKLTNTKIYLKNTNYKTIITHDIDKCNSGWLQNGYREFKDIKIKQGIRTIYKKLIRNKDVWFNFDKILEIEKKHSIKSTYFFLVNNKGYKGLENADYKISSPKLKKAISQIQSNHHEIGLHGSYNSGFDLNKLRKEIKKAPHSVKGNRFHYLAMNIPQTFNILQKSHLSYDSSLGFSENIGFRNGFCYPFYPYNIKKDNIYRFLEFPVNIMDISLQKKRYMNLSPQRALDRCVLLINHIKKFNGILNILWHNYFFTGYKYREWKGVFEKLLLKNIKNKSYFLKLKDYSRKRLGSVTKIMKKDKKS